MRNKLWLWYAVVVGNGPVQHGIPSPIDRTLPARGYPLKDFVSAYALEHGCRRGLYRFSAGREDGKGAYLRPWKHGSYGISRVPGQAVPVGVGFFFGNTELSLALWNVIAEVSGFDD